MVERSIKSHAGQARQRSGKPNWIASYDDAEKSRTRSLVGYDIQEYDLNSFTGQDERSRTTLFKGAEDQLLANYRALAHSSTSPETLERLDTARLEIKLVFGEHYLNAFEVFTALEHEMGNLE